MYWGINVTGLPASVVSTAVLIAGQLCVDLKYKEWKTAIHICREQMF